MDVASFSELVRNTILFLDPFLSMSSLMASSARSRDANTPIEVSNGPSWEACFASTARTAIVTAVQRKPSWRAKPVRARPPQAFAGQFDSNVKFCQED